MVQKTLEIVDFLSQVSMLLGAFNHQIDDDKLKSEITEITQRLFRLREEMESTIKVNQNYFVTRYSVIVNLPIMRRPKFNLYHKRTDEK